MMTLKEVTRGLSDDGEAGEALTESNEANSSTAKFARLKAWRIFLKTAQKLLNQITAVTGLITIEYLLILSQSKSLMSLEMKSQMI